MPDTNINDLIEALRRHGEQEFARGIEVGRAREREAMLNYLRQLPAHTVHAAAAPEGAAQAAPATGEKRSKAPKGLAEKILKDLLTAHPGLSLGDLEAAALQRDARIARKSVYNHLNANRNKLYRNAGDGKWFLLETTPERIVTELSAPAPERPMVEWPAKSAWAGGGSS